MGRLLTIIALLHIFVAISCKGKMAATTRSSAKEDADSEEYAGTGSASAVSGTNLLPVCTVSRTSMALLADSFNYDCVLNACSSASGCKDVGAEGILPTTSWRWALKSRTSKLVLDFTCSPLDSGVRYVCQGSDDNAYIELRVNAADVAEAMVHATSSARVESISPLALQIGSNNALMTVTGSGFVKASDTSIAVAVGSLNCVTDLAAITSSPFGTFPCTIASVTATGAVPQDSEVVVTYKEGLSNLTNVQAASILKLTLKKKVTLSQNTPTPTPSPTPTVTPTPTATPSPTPTPPQGYFIFRTSGTYSGNLAGEAAILGSPVDGADAGDVICNAVGNGSTLLAGKGPFKAVLSDSLFTIATHLALTNVGAKVYVLFSSGASTEVFSAAGKIYDGVSPLLSKVNVNQNGVVLGAPVHVWTGFNGAFPGTFHCADWNSVTHLPQGQAGDNDVTSAPSWISAGQDACNSANALLCISAYQP